MNTCDICGYKIISNARFETHKATHSVQYPDLPPESVVRTEAPVETPAVQAVPDDIKIRFMKPVEITINGKLYAGKELTITPRDGGIQTASEIVRIAREAYGPTILA